MLFEGLSDLFQKYAKEIHKEYEQNSRIPLLSRIQAETDPQALNFMKFGRRFIVPREYFEPGRLIIVRPFAESILLSEYQCIIDALREASTARHESQTPPNRTIIDNAVSELLRLTRPDYIIIPIAFLVELSRASMRTRSPDTRFIEYDRGSEYYNYAGCRLNILWSNKYINLNEVIIGNSQDGLWLFKPEVPGHDDRLTVRFEVNEGLDPTLLVQTIFKYIPPAREKVYVISYPVEMCRIA
jgi:hypothetical protein